MPVKKKRTGKKISATRKTTKKKTTKKKIIKKRVIKKTPPKKKIVAKKPLKKENIIGAVTHYFPKVRAAVIKLKAPLATGDSIKIKGHTTDFTQNIASMQIDHVPVNQAKKGEEIGLLVNSRVRKKDVVIKT